VEAEIAPTRGSRTQVDRPIAVVSNVNTAPALLTVHIDHLNRPVKMTNSSGAIVWNAVWQPWGGAHTLTGAEALNARFPGQWFQLEAGLHYNWHRHYDPSLGRYTQPDPLVFEDEFEDFVLPGFQDGPSLYAYAGNSPHINVDEDGQFIPIILGIGGGLIYEIILDKYCGCPSNAGSYAASASAGGAIGDFVSPIAKTSKRLGKSSRYLSRLSRFFTKVTGNYKLKKPWPAPTLRYPRSTSRTLGIVLGRASAPLGASYLFLRTIHCLSQ
jgi:RHS repeat-associated protein